MNSNAFGLVELIGVFAVILGVLGWQWVSIRKTLRQDRDKERNGSPPDDRTSS